MPLALPMMMSLMMIMLQTSRMLIKLGIQGPHKIEACRNIPHDGMAKENKHNIKPCLSPREKISGVATNVYLRKTSGKTKKRFVNFENKGSGVIYA